MKTKQTNIKAVFTTENSNAQNYSGSKELASVYKLIDGKTGACVVDCRVYVGKSRNSSTVYASIWVNSIKENKKPDGFKYGCTSGSGQAGGWGYCKESKAIESAIHAAGIELYGTPYKRGTEKVVFKKRAFIGGTGCHESALLAIGYACGYSDLILVRV